MARGRRSAPRRRRSYSRSPVRRIRRGFSGAKNPLMKLVLAALATIVGLLVAAKFLPSNYAIAGGLGIGGAGAYLMGEKASGEAMLGTAIGIAALPTVASVIGSGGSKTSTGGQVWS